MLHGKPVQFREVQGYESERFLSYFPRFICMQGGVASGFHHVSDPPPLNIRKLYRVTFSRSTVRSNLVVREVPAIASSLVEGDTYVLDKGATILQFNTKGSAGQERFKAAEFAQSLSNERKSQSEVVVYGEFRLSTEITFVALTLGCTDEGLSGATRFLNEFGENTTLKKADDTAAGLSEDHPILFRISDATGVATFNIVTPTTTASLSSQDAFLLDYSNGVPHPAIFVWIGKEASLNESRLALQYAQRYLYDKKLKADRVRVAIPIMKMKEGEEMSEFLHII